MKAVAVHKDKVGIARACNALGVARSSYYRSLLPAKALAKRQRPPRALTRVEKACVLSTLNSEEFCDQAPRQIWATLLDKNQYLAHWRTMYRILEENGQVKERRLQLRHPIYEAPELLATRPNEVWSWDITRMRGPEKWSCFYLYVIMDIFSRYVVGWMIAQRESAILAKELITVSCQRQGVERNALTIHSDRGPSMTSKTVAQLLVDLEIEKSLSRPHVSNDNPYSEAQFKTMKYRPDYPKRFGSIEDARNWAREFFCWYNDRHHHSGIGLLPPAVVHYGNAVAHREQRMDVLGTAFAAHPERFVRGAPKLPQLPTAVWINKPVETDKAVEPHKNEVVVQSINKPETGDGRSGSNKNLILTPGHQEPTLDEAATSA